MMGFALALGACANVPAPRPTGGAPEGKLGLANPASVHCARLGGRVVIEKRPNGDAYGLCLFEDNRQCEEWALLRGHCPSGGLKVTGYPTAAARHCAATGGHYRVTRAGEAEREEAGDCILPDGQQCAADAFYRGACP